MHELPPIGGRGECRVPDAPAAARVVVVNTRVSHHGYTGSPGIPARNGFNGFLRDLPGDRAFLPPSPRGTFRRLDASVEASGPYDFAVRQHTPSSEAPPASIASRPASVTIAIRPSVGWDGGNVDLIWVSAKGFIFAEGLDSWNQIETKGEFFLCAHAPRHDKIVALNASIKNATLVRKRRNSSLAR